MALSSDPEPGDLESGCAEHAETGQIVVPEIDHRGFDWQQLPPGTIRSTFKAASGQLAMISWGDESAPRVICIPGITGSKEDFSLVGPVLAEHGYRVDAIDLAGQYESALAGPEPGGRYDLDLHYADLKMLTAGDQPVHLVAYSFAGIIAERLLAEEPGRVRSLTLLSVPPLVGQSFRGIRKVGRLHRQFSAKAAASVMLWGIRKNLNGTDATRYAFVMHRLGWTSTASVVDAMEVMMNVPDYEEAMRSSGIPIMVAAGKKDLWPTETHQEFARRIGGRFRSYDTGHSPSETTPAELSRDLLAFFRDAG